MPGQVRGGAAKAAARWHRRRRAAAARRRRSQGATVGRTMPGWMEQLTHTANSEWQACEVLLVCVCVGWGGGAKGRAGSGPEPRCRAASTLALHACMRARACACACACMHTRAMAMLWFAVVSLFKSGCRNVSLIRDHLHSPACKSTCCTAHALRRLPSSSFPLCGSHLVVRVALLLAVRAQMKRPSSVPRQWCAMMTEHAHGRHTRCARLGFSPGASGLSSSSLAAAG